MVWELYPLNQVTWQRAYVESDVNAKSEVFLDFFIIMMTLLFLPRQYIWGNQEKLEFLDNQRGKNGPARKRFRLYRKLQQDI